MIEGTRTVAKPRDLAAFKKAHCRLCHHCSAKPCQIEHDGTLWGVDSPLFPRQWVSSVTGVTCTAFDHIDEPLKYRCPDTLELPL